MKGKETRSPEKIGSMGSGKLLCGRKWKGEKGRAKKNMREQDSQNGGRTEIESKERHCD